MKRRKRITTSLLLLSILLMTLSCKNQDKSQELQDAVVKVDYLNESEADFDKRMAWWRDARFGMFIHWGPYAVPAGTHKGEKIKGIGEWIMERGKIPIAEYENYARAFNPVDFNADAWAKLMKDAGMKYVVITSKHHDGFALWDSKVSSYDMVDFTPYGKDILKQLSEACRTYGIKFGTYHSIMDWHHPMAQGDTYTGNRDITEEDKIEFEAYLEQYLKPQVKELITAYDTDILWFDGEWVKEFTHDQGKALYQYVRELKPDIIINNRVDKGRQGMQGMNKEDADYAGDFGTPEQEILEQASSLDWESCMTMNDTWGFKSYDHNWKSTSTLVHNLIDIVSKGGNYLLNVGPTAEGLIPEPSVTRLTEMGSWLAVNGEAIYNSQRFQNNFKQGESIRFTKTKGTNTLYAITLEKPESVLTIKHMVPEPNSSIQLLGHPGDLEWDYNETSGLSIHLPEDLLSGWNDTTYAWTFKITGKEI
ncbi:alpha-L-fucosidase [Aestuariivivens sediminicola]|uniref:alpha-L-fucosidase n=1 Tax=Aestuariivivens sediminicola TaxID=2913560 RepID=UPI001F57FAE7|nr:alpha-L-fucosidase [Aestuariivivens sediminicola]